MPRHIVYRDMTLRACVAATEVARRAVKFVARNTLLPARLRVKAQLELNSFPRWTRPSGIRDRCVLSGRGSQIIGDFKLNKNMFRVLAKRKQLPGVHEFRPKRDDLRQLEIVQEWKTHHNKMKALGKAPSESGLRLKGNR
ncbi:MAG: hypothetical protein BJ554DRAFT_5233 [Olpidium bornovanus]|uniref:Uncharacterized protein n=1 Tax=Olpidium bornovanus TaxID=278681 RepID=A0A8H7ZL63_9FUNG|nr:MAG: hypothetical protein BJ554DRAFT_5233 [Olpidium bornovanus]